MTSHTPMSDPDSLRTMPVADVVRSAWRIGQEIDLTGVGYGRAHVGSGRKIQTRPSGYYYFLAGLARLCAAKRICEIGTHWGGSARALWNGVPDKDNAVLVTIDITQESDPHLASFPRIVKIVGDANTPKILRAVAQTLDYEPIDMLYIDADHAFMPTYRQYCLYAMAFRPKLVVFDDITLNPGMREAWKFISRSVPPADSVNTPEIVPEIRPEQRGPGFGMVILRHNF